MKDEILLNNEVAYNEVYSSLECLSTGERIHLTPNERKLLNILLAQRGLKDTIIDEIWTQQGIVVTASSYHQLVKMLRGKFQQTGLSPEFIKTIPRYGMILCLPSHVSKEVNTSVELEKRTTVEDASESDGVSQTFIPPVDEGSNCHEISGSQTHHEALSKVPMNIALYAISFLFIVLVGMGAVSFRLEANKGKLPFPQQQQFGNVIYHATSTALLSKPTVMAQAFAGVLKDTKHIYLASNGPKVWVSYCKEQIEKENSACHHACFSVY